MLKFGAQRGRIIQFTVINHCKFAAASHFRHWLFAAFRIDHGKPSMSKCGIVTAPDVKVIRPAVSERLSHFFDRLHFIFHITLKINPSGNSAHTFHTLSWSFAHEPVYAEPGDLCTTALLDTGIFCFFIAKLLQKNPVMPKKRRGSFFLLNIGKTF